MTLRPSILLAPRTVTTEIALEPAVNFVNTCLLITYAGHNYGVDEWVERTAAALPDHLHRQGRTLFAGIIGLMDVIVCGRWPSVEAYLAWLETLDPDTMRADIVRAMLAEAAHIAAETGTAVDQPAPGDLLDSADVYVSLIDSTVAAHKGDPLVYPDSLREGHALLNDPPALHRTLLEYLREMWHAVLHPQWERSLPVLQESADALRRLDAEGLTALEAIRVITGRDMRGMIDEELADTEHLIFVPTAHIGPYLSWYKEGKTTWMLFRARVPEGVRPRSPEITRSEILVRMSALDDDTRLRILELITQHDELCAQDIITTLDVSQSAASRHLRQLVATGYLVERRSEGNKCYRLNPERIEATLRALSNFLLGR